MDRNEKDRAYEVAYRYWNGGMKGEAGSPWDEEVRDMARVLLREMKRAYKEGYDAARLEAATAKREKP